MLEKLRKKPKLLQKLDEGEKLWVKEQNTLPEEKLKRDAEKANHHMLYLQSLLAKCQKHGCSFISKKEIDQCLKGIKDDIEKKCILCVNVQYHLYTSGSDAQQRPNLYKVNQLPLVEIRRIL